jgi:S-adenosylmethionine:tRNA ribosyltransferase-isomerase
MRTEDFDYELPTGLIAQQPAEPRDSCRLLVVDRASGMLDDRVFTDLPEMLRPGDLLVVNETRVLPARLRGVKADTGGAVEVLLLRERYEGAWECLVRPGRRIRAGTKVAFSDGRMTGLVVAEDRESGGRVVQFTVHGDGASAPGAVRAAIHEIGEMPLPPYITRPLADPEQYQTVFGTDERSAAAPTAGLHFTEELLERIEHGGVNIAHVELDVGLDTFRPVAEDDPEDHPIHTEHFRVAPLAAQLVNETHARGGRVVAVGTTVVRALESAVDEGSGLVLPTEGDTDLFILPGFRFLAVDAMITNFHVPRSTLLMLVSAFASRDLVMRAYSHALDRRYRFLSFGDAVLFE